MTVSGPGTPEPRSATSGVRTQSPRHHPFAHALTMPGLLLPIHEARAHPSSSPGLCPEPPPTFPPPFSLQASSVEQLRKEGNELFKCGDYEGALGAYTQALGLDATPQDQAILHRNRAACHLKLVREPGALPLACRGPSSPISADAWAPAGNSSSQAIPACQMSFAPQREGGSGDLGQREYPCCLISAPKGR